MRITDVCPRLDDAVTIAALFVCVCRMLCRTHLAQERAHPLLLLNENRWRAQRYGIAGELIDRDREGLISCHVLIRELLAEIAQDAEAQGCTAEINRVTALLADGTSADRQIATYEHLRQSGLSDAHALKGVVDLFVTETSTD